MKFTDEQLSMILSAHESGQLIRHGCYDWHLSTNLPKFKGSGCLYQVAFNNPDEGGEGGDINVIGWFDDHYDPNWPADFFLYELELQGVA